jgi:hypothetical protein
MGLAVSGKSEVDNEIWAFRSKCFAPLIYYARYDGLNYLEAVRVSWLRALPGQGVPCTYCQNTTSGSKLGRRPSVGLAWKFARGKASCH